MPQWYAICNSDYAECDPGMGGKGSGHVEVASGKDVAWTVLCCSDSESGGVVSILIGPK